MRKKLVVLSGPSCVGKGPLRAALRRHHPKLKIAELVLCNSRKPRLKDKTKTYKIQQAIAVDFTAKSYEIHGVDYYFLPRGLIEQLDRKNFVVEEVHSDKQAIDMMQVAELLKSDEYEIVLAEVFHKFGAKLKEWSAKVKDDPKFNFEVVSVFLRPLSEEEIEKMVKEEGKTREQIIYEVMKGKLERRSEDPPAKREKRAKYAVIEMADAHNFDEQIVNHAGEDDREEWTDPLGDEAKEVLKKFVNILKR